MKRPEQIKLQFLEELENHLNELIDHKVEDMYSIDYFSKKLCISPIHLSNTIKETTGVSACEIFHIKIMEKSLNLLSNTDLKIKDIAINLTYEPTQFTKWFKKFIHLTPKQYRRRIKAESKISVNSELMTILKSKADIPLYF